jgi:predicted MFS family arabinose efflux permease
VGAVAETFGLRAAFAAAAALTLIACIWVAPRRRAMTRALEAERG